MTIYVSHSKGFDYQKDLYEPLKSLGKNLEFIFPHEKSGVPYPTKQLFQDKKCDIVLAEVSYPATGQGIELGWADIFQIPIICIYKKDTQTSGSVKLICENIYEYSSPEELLTITKKILNLAS